MPQSATAFPALDTRADLRRPEPASVKAGASGEFAARLDETVQPERSGVQERSAWQDREPASARSAAGPSDPAPERTARSEPRPVSEADRTSSTSRNERHVADAKRSAARAEQRRQDRTADRDRAADRADDAAQSADRSPTPSSAKDSTPSDTSGPAAKVDDAPVETLADTAQTDGQDDTQAAAIVGTAQAVQAAIALALLAQGTSGGVEGAPAPEGEPAAGESGVVAAAATGDGKKPAAAEAHQASAGGALPGARGGAAGLRTSALPGQSAPRAETPEGDGVVFTGKPAIEAAPQPGKTAAPSAALAALSAALADGTANAPAGGPDAVAPADAGANSPSPTPHLGHLAAATGGVGATDARTGAPGPAVPAVPIAALPIEIGMRALEGSQNFNIKLHPHDLGQVDVKLQIDDDGVVKAHVTVDRVETLNMLQRDSRTLERAFEQAGLKTSDGSLQFSLGSDTSQQQRSGRQQEQSTQQAPAAPLTDLSASPDLAAALRAIRVPLSGLDIRI